MHSEWIKKCIVMGENCTNILKIILKQVKKNISFREKRALTIVQ